MRRALLLLNIVIGLAIFYLIWMFTDLTPGGRSSQTIAQIEAIRAAAVASNTDIQQLLDDYVLCKATPKPCYEFQESMQRVETQRSQFDVAMRGSLVSNNSADALRRATLDHRTAALRVVGYLRTEPELDRDFVAASTELRLHIQRATNHLMAEIDVAIQGSREKARKQAKSAQFIFVFLLIGVWTYSALLTETVMRPKKR